MTVRPSIKRQRMPEKSGIASPRPGPFINHGFIETWRGTTVTSETYTFVQDFGLQYAVGQTPVNGIVDSNHTIWVARSELISRRSVGLHDFQVWKSDYPHTEFDYAYSLGTFSEPNQVKGVRHVIGYDPTNCYVILGATGTGSFGGTLWSFDFTTPGSLQKLANDWPNSDILHVDRDNGMLKSFDINTTPGADHGYVSGDGVNLIVTPFTEHPTTGVWYKTASGRWWKWVVTSFPNVYSLGYYSSDFDLIAEVNKTGPGGPLPSITNGIRPFVDGENVVLGVSIASERVITPSGDIFQNTSVRHHSNGYDDPATGTGVFQGNQAGLNWSYGNVVSWTSDYMSVDGYFYSLNYEQTENGFYDTPWTGDPNNYEDRGVVRIHRYKPSIESSQPPRVSVNGEAMSPRVRPVK